MVQKVLYLVSEDWYFVSHRLPMARAARGAGYEVHVATRIAAHAAAIEREGFILHPLDWRRGSFDPLRLLSAVRAVRRLYRRVRPDIVHHVALMPAVIGSLAALGLPIICLNAVAGLGFAFTTRTPKALLLRALMEPMLRRLFGRVRVFVLVQNPDDRAAIQSLGVSGDKIMLIAGSGVDIDALSPLPEPPPPVAVGFVGRLLTDKGVPTLVEAHALLARRGRPVTLLIAGEPDPPNPASITQAIIAEWRQRPGLTLLGQVDDIGAFWARAHIAVLPSLREGLPMSLLEAAACARPIVATDVPGCREIARNGVNALLVPPNAAAALADAIDRLARDADLRRRFGAAGRRIVEDEFSHFRIGQEIVALYRRLLSLGPDAG
ncbi:MAG TPA: glycosyltransferase family 4 protein [Pseudolabrys sp.]|jgi:glycosyltransferase involved in cell wall biosynthesis